MRLSEKTLEISLCCQISQRLSITNALWVGLTQRQERELGFDVATRINARMIILQYKASDTVTQTWHFATPARRFHLPHQQLERLQRIAAVFPSCVHYVLPDIGNTVELANNADLVSQSWTLDVSQLTNPFPPSGRSSGNHLAYLQPPRCVISSDPQEIEPMKLGDFCRKLMDFRANSREMSEWLKRHIELLRGRKLYGLIF